MKILENKSKNKKGKSHRFFGVSPKIQRSSNLLFPLLARGLEGIKYFLNICNCFYAQNYLIRRSLEFFANAKNRDDSSFLDDEAKTVAHHGLKRSLRGFRYAQPLKMTMIICFVLCLGVAGESWATCNGATATTAGTDEENQPCGSWDCGATGSNVTCTLSKGTLTISGEGAMKDYTSRRTGENYPLTYKSSTPWAGTMITKAIIEGNVTRLGDQTFVGEIYLTEVSGMDSVTSLGRSVFDRCTSLTSVDIPNVTNMGEYVFHIMPSLQYINMRSDVQISGTVFENTAIPGPCTTNPETGMKTCGSCGDKYVKSGTGCVTEENCGAGYYADEASKKCLYCPQSKVVYKGQCLDEYPFAKKRYTPAEAAQWLNEDDNTITLTFKK